MGKIGRNKKKCEVYKKEGKREKNKKMKQLRYELKMEKAKQRKIIREEKRKKIKTDVTVASVAS